MSRKLRQNNSSPLSLFAFQDIITAVTGIMLLVVLLMVLTLALRRASAMIQKPLEMAVLEKLDAELQVLQEELAARRQWIDDSKDRIRRVSAVDIDRLPEKIETTKIAVEILEETVKRREQEEADLRRKVEVEEGELTALTGKNTAVAAAVEELASGNEAALQETEDLKNEVKKKREVSANLVELRISEKTGKLPVVVVCSDTELLVLGSGLAGEVSFKGTGPTTQEMMDRFARWLAGRSARREYFTVLLKPSAAGLYLHFISTFKKHGFEFGFEAIAEETMVKL